MSSDTRGREYDGAAQPVQHRQDGRSLQRRTVVAVQDGALGLRMDALCQCGPLDQLGGVISGFCGMHFMANDFAVAQI